MSQHHKASAELDPKGRAALTAAAAKIGTGKQLKPEHFAALSTAERTALYHADLPRYEALRDGIDPDAPWTPTAGQTRDSIAQADL